MAVTLVGIDKLNNYLDNVELENNPFTCDNLVVLPEQINFRPYKFGEDLHCFQRELICKRRTVLWTRGLEDNYKCEFDLRKDENEKLVGFCALDGRLIELSVTSFKKGPYGI